jgi:hypothetical protein
MTESSVLITSKRTKPSSTAAFAFVAALRRLEPGPQVSNRPRAMATVGAGSRHAAGRAKMGRRAVSNGDWIRTAANAVAFIRTRYAAAAPKDPITM